MPKPTLLVQLSDLHIGGNEGGLDPIPRLEAVIEAVRSLPNRPNAALVSGDLTDDGAAEGYRVVREMLARLEVPLHVIPGNHDDRGRLREAFDLPGSGRLRLDRPRPGSRRLPAPAAALARRGAGRRAGGADPARSASPAALHRHRRVGRDQPLDGAARGAGGGCRPPPATAGGRRRPPAPGCRLRPRRPPRPRRAQHLLAGPPRLRGRRRVRRRRRPRLRDSRPTRRRALLAGGVGPVQPGCLTALGARCSWTKRTTAAPSPTAIAQRLIEPARTSPAA
jgi:calcineurin-like phosphoesterase family protein